MNIRSVLLIIGVGIIIWLNLIYEPEMPPPGLLAVGEPFQNNSLTIPPFTRDTYTIKPVAKYSIKARVLSTSRYRFTSNADLVPIDIAFGWNKMSDSSILSKLSIWQGYRNYWWWISDLNNLPISRHEITESSANMHLIPSTIIERNALFDIKKNQVVQLDGYLVEASRPDGWHWSTSLTRTDSGDGACELMWVEKVLSKVF